jgi:myo-inositol 2-dehydrogenase/D-chiro-inositol 1-dehydrogenase
MNNYPNAAILSDGSSVRRDLPLNFFMDRYTESFANELVAFVDAVLHDKPVPISGSDARVPVVMGLAAAKSHREGRPVKLCEIDSGEG